MTSYLNRKKRLPFAVGIGTFHRSVDLMAVGPLAFMVTHFGGNEHEDRSGFARRRSTLDVCTGIPSRPSLRSYPDRVYNSEGE
jgi:hypothetical protein